MSLVQSPQMTPRKRAANRQNARRSRGPRRPEAKRRAPLNGLRARLFFEAMDSLGEDRREFEEVRQSYLESFQPVSPAEAVMVEDLAKLWWRKERAERAQAGVQVRELERQQHERLREMRDIQRRTLQETDEEIRQIGLLRARDCVAKFEQARQLLEMLIAHVEGRYECEHPQRALRLLYGEKPTWRGSSIQSLFEQLAKEQEAGTDAPLPPEEYTPPPLDELRAPPDPDDLPPTEESLREEAMAGLDPGGAWARYAQAPESSTRSLLRLSLLEEWSDVLGEHEMFLAGYVELSRAAREALLAPADSRWTWMLRQEGMLERHFDRKLKQLVKMVSLRRVLRRRGAKFNGDNGKGSKPRPSRPPRTEPKPNAVNEIVAKPSPSRRVLKKPKPNVVNKIVAKARVSETLKSNDQSHDVLCFQPAQEIVGPSARCTGGPQTRPKTTATGLVGASRSAGCAPSRAGTQFPAYARGWRQAAHPTGEEAARCFAVRSRIADLRFQIRPLAARHGGGFSSDYE